MSLDRASYREKVVETNRLGASGLSSAEAARFRAAEADHPTTIRGTADITDFGNFLIQEDANGKHFFLRAADGNYEASQNGVSYEQVPSNQARQIFDALEGGVQKLGSQLRVIKVLGAGVVGGLAVHQYLGTLPAGTLEQLQRVFLSLLGPGVSVTRFVKFHDTITIDVATSTGFPVRFVEAENESVAAAHLNRKLHGVLSVSVASTRSFSDFRPHRRAG